MNSADAAGSAIAVVIKSWASRLPVAVVRLDRRPSWWRPDAITLLAQVTRRRKEADEGVSMLRYDYERGLVFVAMFMFYSKPLSVIPGTFSAMV